MIRLAHLEGDLPALFTLNQLISPEERLEEFSASLGLAKAGTAWLGVKPWDPTSWGAPPPPS